MRRILWGLWWLSAAFLALCLVWFGWVVYAYTQDQDEDDPFDRLDEVECSEVIAFAGAALPDRMSDQDCTSENWTLDESYDGTWLMPRADVAGWLKESYPDRTLSACGVRYCLDILSDAPGDADQVRLTVSYENKDTAFVELEARST